MYDGAVAQTGTRALASAISVTKKAHMVKMCEYGLHQCPQDEECVLRSSSKSRFGKCDCLQGYHRDDQNVCLGATSPARKLTIVSFGAVDSIFLLPLGEGLEIEIKDVALGMGALNLFSGCSVPAAQASFFHHIS